MATSKRVFVIGVGMTKFEKPGSRENFDYPDMAKEAGEKALKDANLTYDKVQQAFVGYVYGESTSGQRALYELGMTGIPIVNVNNNCSTGSSALYLARNAILTGKVDCVMALGFEKMQKGSLTSSYNDRANPMEKHLEVMSQKYDITASPMTAQMFGNAGRDYMKKYNLNDDSVFAKIAHKNHKHSVNNPYAQFQKEYTLDEVKNSPMIYEPLTKLQCSPTSDGAACAILATEDFVVKHNLQSRAVEILALEMATDVPQSFNNGDCTNMVGFAMSQLAAQRAYQISGVSPQQVQVVELHDCFSANELITYEALGLCAPGKAAEMVNNNDNTYGGKYVVNPSGGLISKGHPLGATGIAQCSELTWQLRGEAGKRQVPNVKYALQHNIGLGGAAIVGVYKLGFGTGAAPQAATTAAAPAQTSASGSSELSKSTTQHASGKMFDEIDQKLKTEGKSFVDKINAIIGFKITADKNTYSYVVNLKTGPGTVSIDNGSVKSDCTVSIADSDLVSIMEGKLNMMSAFTQKKLKLSGNMAVAMKLNQLFTSILTERKKAGTTAPAAAAAPAAPAPAPAAQPSSSGSSAISSVTSTHKSGKFFDEIYAKLKEDAKNLSGKVNAIIGFAIACDNQRTLNYVIDLKSGANSTVFVNDGKTKPECTIAISDDDLLSIVQGKLNMMTAFTQKKVKISGNMGIAMKLNQLFASVKPTSKL